MEPERPESATRVREVGGDRARPLDYFDPRVASPAGAVGLSMVWVVVLLGLVPYACGMVSALAVRRSGEPNTILVHSRTGRVFMAASALVTLTAIGVFVYQRRWLSAGAAGLLLGGQISVAVCSAPV